MRPQNDLSRTYVDQGFVLVRGAVPEDHIRTLELLFLELVESRSGRSFTSLDDPALADLLAADHELERTLYDEVRQYPWLVDFTSHESIAGLARQLLDADIGLMSKIPFRIDLPRVTRELAVWHQDFFYVKGNTDVVTAWIPMQETTYERGCLMVMPGSQRLGALPHDRQALHKRSYPDGIFGREVRYVEMRRGDALLFGALLLHSSGINISNGVRCSVQARYSRLSDPVDASMGLFIDLPESHA